MSATAYKLVGLVVWKVLKGYLRQRLPRARPLALKVLAGIGVVAGAVLLARRAIG